MGNLEGVRLLGTFERQMEGSGNGVFLIKLLLPPFKDQTYVRALSVWAICYWCEGSGIPMTWHQIMGAQRASFKV